MDQPLPRLCDYGCGKKGIFQLKNGKVCCNKIPQRCPEVKRKISESNKNPSYKRRQRSSEIHKGKIPWNKGKSDIYSEKTIRKMKTARKNKTYEEIFGKEKAKDLKKIRSKRRLTISKINKKYPFFAKIEDLRYNPDKPNEKEIQVHCKNHNCKNSKEQGGWFTPTYQQIKTRRDWIENEGIDICNFYCSKECKNTCPLYKSKGGRTSDNKKIYTQQEYEIFRMEVLKRQREEFDYNFCELCYSVNKLHIHHEKPKRIHPIFSLDPDNGIILCEKCHLKKIHTGKCSTGEIYKICKEI